MSRRRGLFHGVRAGFPRVSGDEPAVTLGPDKLTVFSPRERG